MPYWVINEIIVITGQAGVVAVKVVESTRIGQEGFRVMAQVPFSNEVGAVTEVLQVLR